MENGRVRVDAEEVERILHAYGTPAGRRSEVIEIAAEAATPVAADAMAWITSHAFRKTTATILDDAGHSTRQVADQLGHARPSLTQDVYMGRKAENPAAADALETITHPISHTWDGFAEAEPASDLQFVRRRGLEPRTR